MPNWFQTTLTTLMALRPSAAISVPVEAPAVALSSGYNAPEDTRFYTHSPVEPMVRIPGRGCCEMPRETSTARPKLAALLDLARFSRSAPAAGRPYSITSPAEPTARIPLAPSLRTVPETSMEQPTRAALPAPAPCLKSLRLAKPYCIALREAPTARIPTPV